MTLQPSCRLHIKIIDVGEGDASLIVLPESKRALVVDAYDGERVCEALLEAGIEEVVLFLSHSDRDHIAGVQYLLDNYQGSYVAFFYNKDRLTAGKDSLYRRTINTMAFRSKAQGARSASLDTNCNDLTWFSSLVSLPITLEVLHPAYSESGCLYGNCTNDVSGVLHVSYLYDDGSKQSVLFTGDVQLTGISCMMTRLGTTDGVLRADVLKYPHHGAWPTTYEALSTLPNVGKHNMEEFLRAVDPRFIILSVGFNNDHNHVDERLFQALTDLSAERFRLERVVCTQFTKTCLAQEDAETSVACAGDIDINIGPSVPGRIEVLPAVEKHREKVRAATSLSDLRCAHLIERS